MKSNPSRSFQSDGNLKQAGLMQVSAVRGDIREPENSAIARCFDDRENGIDLLRLFV